MGGSFDTTSGAGFPQAWAAALRGCGHIVAMNSAEVGAFLARLAADLAKAREGDRACAVMVGEQLVRAHFVDDEVLGRSIATIHTHCVAESAGPGDGHAPVGVAGVLDGIATGYVRAFREWVLAEQESLRAADVAARRTAEQQLRASEARLRAVFAQAGVGTGISEMSGRIVEANPAFAHMLGYEVEEFCRFAVTDLTHPEDDPAMWQRYAELIAGRHDCLRLEKAYRHRDGTTVWTNLNVSLIRDQNGDPQYTLVLVEDISEQRQLRERLRHRASHDALTGLPNRAQFFDALTAAFADPTSRVGLCYIDLDRFKIVNDTLGHHVGDHLLAAVAQRLRACLPNPGQLIARIGGDEFVVLVPQSRGTDDVAAVAAEVLAALAKPFDIDGHRLVVSASIGVTEERAGATTASDLMKAADTTMYWAKQNSCGRFALFDRERSNREITRYGLSSAMRTALHRGEFFVEYQPIVALADNTLLGVEALLRWQHPTLHTLGPDKFIDLAEDNGLIEPLGAFVLDRACRDARGWHDLLGNRAPFVSVNLAAVQAGDNTLVDQVRRITQAAGLPPTALHLELTERTIIDPDGRARSVLGTLRELGVKIAIDDFGSGHSNLAFLGRLPVDSLKLAGPFIGRLDDTDATAPDETIVRAIVDLAHALGMTVTAECVETPAQAGRLAALGCDAAQGWYFAEPMPAHHITELLRATNPSTLPRG